MKKKSNKTLVIVILVAIVALGLLAFGGNISSYMGGTASSTATQSTREIAMSCTLDMYTTFHIHPHLRIIINGLAQTIPADTGITPVCLHPLHTHDDTGTIHVESPVKRDFTLSDFFAVWGKTFNKNQILDAKTDAAHEIVMTVNGQPSSAYEDLILKNLDQIVIEYRPIAR